MLGTAFFENAEELRLRAGVARHLAWRALVIDPCGFFFCQAGHSKNLCVAFKPSLEGFASSHPGIAARRRVLQSMT
jgi:hypothetical protein